MVEHYLAKVNTRVRFPPLAPFIKQSRFARDFLFSKEKEGRFAGLLRKDFLNRCNNNLDSRQALG